MVTAASIVVLFDVMGTLVEEPFYESIPRFFGMTLAELREQSDPTSWIEFEHGRMDERTYFERFFADRRPIDGAGLCRTLREGYAWMEGMQSILTELSNRDVPMHALSNYPEWFQHIEDKLRLSRYLDWTFVSCNTGVRKPAAEAYLGPAKTLGVEPCRCLFVDDRRCNCDAAEGVGMPAILFKGHEPLRAELVARGLL